MTRVGEPLDSNEWARSRGVGYRIEWFIGDHGPKHVHVYDAKERFLGRLNIERMRGMEGWDAEQKID